MKKLTKLELQVLYNCVDYRQLELERSLSAYKSEHKDLEEIKVKLRAEIEKREKCKHCNKPRYDHNGKTRGCPIGSKHKVLSYTQFSNKTFYESKE